MRYLTTDLFGKNLWNEVDRLFDFPVHAKWADEKFFAPATEIHENEKTYMVSMDLPGLKKDEIKIEVVNNVLTVSGERRQEKNTQNGRVNRVEKYYGSFKRSFDLPQDVDGSKINAKYEDGVLELAVPKSDAVVPRKIEIQ